jgi:hypothetical protein
MARGEAVMAMALGRARRDGLVPGDAAECFAAAAAAGDPDGAFHFALQGAADGEADTALWVRVLAAAHNNSPAARAYLVAQRRAGRTPREFAAATDALLDRPAVEGARR